MKIIVIVIMALGLVSCKAQEGKSKIGTEKIDSVFNYYFYLFELETSRRAINETSERLYQKIILESDTVYILKDLPQAVSLVSEMSDIKIHYSEKSEEMLLTKDIVNLWFTWYNENRHRIIWNNSKDKPVLVK